MCENQEYNGWTNHATWMVHLHLSSTESIYNMFRAIAAEEYESERQAIDNFKDTLLEMLFGDDMSEPAAYTNSSPEGMEFERAKQCMISDLVDSYLDDVDWKEVYEAFREE